MKVVLVVGARPNLIKAAALWSEMAARPGIEPTLIHTGQHYDRNMSDVFFEELGLPTPDHALGVGSGSHTQQTARVMLALEPLLERLGPDVLLVVGDVNSTVAATLVAAKLDIPVAHVEAGLRSFDRTMPEELNRVVTDALSELLFTTERGAGENLRREGIPADRVHFVGNVMIDTLRRHWERASRLDVPARYGLRPRGYALLTLHRPSNVDSPTHLAEILAAVAEIQRRLPVIFPVHPRTRARLAEFGLLEGLEALGDVHMTEPLGYLPFLGLVGAARLVLTDSGGIQEETTALGVPCLTLRENTERPVTLTEGTNRLVGTSRAAIGAAAAEALGREEAGGRYPELWDGRAAGRIVEVLERRFGGPATAPVPNEGALTAGGYAPARS